jgi:hypothetical protein
VGGGVADARDDFAVCLPEEGDIEQVRLAVIDGGGLRLGDGDVVEGGMR